MRKGLSVKKMEPKHALICGAYFGGFQALMPTIGYLLGSQFESMITQIDHWIAFVLLGIIGINMIKESREDEDEELNASFDVKTMLALAVATSIDALAVGVTFAFLHVNIVWAVTFIGCTTFILSAIGVKVGNVFGMKYKSKADPGPHGDQDFAGASWIPWLSLKSAAGSRKNGSRRGPEQIKKLKK